MRVRDMATNFWEHWTDFSAWFRSEFLPSLRETFPDEDFPDEDMAPLIPEHPEMPEIVQPGFPRPIPTPLPPEFGGDLDPIGDFHFPSPIIDRLNDWFHGGPIHGGVGRDMLIGRRGADIYVYGQVSDSTGLDADLIFRFDAALDQIDLPVEITAMADAVDDGTLSRRSFDADLEQALGASELGVGEAVLFTPDEGSMRGRTFLVADANGEAGYQAGEDFVIQLLLSQAPLQDLGADIFI